MAGKFRQFGLIGIGVVLGVLVSLNFSAIAQRVGLSPLPVEEMRAFTDVFEAVKRHYVEPVEDKKLFQEAINGMLTGLDPHSSYLDQEAFKELQVSTQGEFGGLGIEVGMEDGFVKVIAPIDDTPAARAGLKPGDFIIKLDDTAVKGMSLNDAVKRMRGSPDTDIVLTVVRKGEPAPFVVKLTRAVIKIQSVKSKLIEPDFGYVRISQFQEHTGESLAKALEALYKQNQTPLKGLLLDLRNDPGGLLNSAVAVSAAFLPQNALVVYTDGRTDDAKIKLTATGEHYLRGRGVREDYLQKLPPQVKSVPIVVLVNAGSASASEIVAGALQDHNRATILGTQTFGKGSVQTIMPLNNRTAIKLTTARYYTPKGRSIQAKGIEPDLLVEDPDNPSSNARLREADLGRHLSNDKDPDAEKKSATTSGPEAKPEATPAPRRERKPLEPGEIVSKDDFQVNQALNHLKGLPVAVTTKTAASK